MTAKLQVVARGEREIVITRSFDAPRTLVWKAHTQPELVKRWLLGPGDWTMPVCKIDLRVGGRYRYVWRHADGREMSMGGIYREISPHDRMVTTELFDDDWTGGEAVTTLVLTEKGGKTTITNTIAYTSREARDAVLKTRMAEGMEAGYTRLEDVLASL